MKNLWNYLNNMNIIEHIKRIQPGKYFILSDDIPKDKFNNLDNIIFIDCNLIKDEITLHQEFMKKLNLPSYYGRSFDALLDMLRDLTWTKHNHLIIILDHFEKLVHKSIKLESSQSDMAITLIEILKIALKTSVYPVDGHIKIKGAPQLSFIFQTNNESQGFIERLVDETAKDFEITTPQIDWDKM